MPHYKSGDVVLEGDKVRGRGYNLKGEIEGYVLQVTPGAEACNVVIGVTRIKHDADPALGIPALANFVQHFAIEYGQADAFNEIEE